MMGDMSSAAAFTLAWLFAYRYLIILPLVVIEGPLVMLICGFLIRLGFFEFWLTYLLLVVGDLIGDVVWYYAGKWGARPIANRYGKYLGIAYEDIERFERFFEIHGTKILLISKLTMGFGLASVTLVSAGAARVPMRSYLTLNLIGGFFWTGFLITIGYFFGNVYFSIGENQRIFFVGFFIALAVTALYFGGRFMRHHFKNI